jgi:hypothetical protein
VTETWNEIQPVHIGDKQLPIVHKYTHLGIERHVSYTTHVSPLITERVKLARRTVYALMGAGLHGLNGLPPTISLKIYTTYALTRFLSNLEATIPTRKDIDAIELYHRTFLRHIQHLPKRTANAAVYLLLGARPIEAELDLKMLTLFASIARKEGSSMARLATRQLLMKSMDSKSWFINIRRVFHKYGLGSPLELLERPMSKARWKKKVNKAVNYYWTKTLQQEASEKSSLSYLNIENCVIGKPHQVWATVTDNPRDVQRAVIKARMLTGVYTLQSHRVTFARRTTNTTSAKCPLCQNEDETIQHFLTECADTKSQVAEFRRNLSELIKGNIKGDELVQFVLDSSECVRCFALNPQITNMIEVLSRNLCFSLHYNRACRLGYRHSVNKKVQTQRCKKTGGGEPKKLPQLLGGRHN